MNDFLQQYGDMILEKTRDHLILALLAMLIACAISVPLGIALARCRARRFAKAMISTISLIQPIPSLALVALVGALFLYMNLPPIGRPPGMVALIAYALLPIIRNTYTGIQQVDKNVIEVARGMGMTECQILTRVELPLALPFIMAGVRISTVWTIGVATLVSLIGASSLGDLIFRGLSRGRVSLILAGAIPAILLALVFEWTLEKMENWLTP
jgi:osmoprotectant transport system permease protein